MTHEYKTFGTCSTKIKFDLDDGKVRNVEFTRGCNGNLKAISKLVEGMEAEKVIGLLDGNTCGMKPTSCADQLAKALAEALKKETCTINRTR